MARRNLPDQDHQRGSIAKGQAEQPDHLYIQALVCRLPQLAR